MEEALQHKVTQNYWNFVKKVSSGYNQGQTDYMRKSGNIF